MQPSSAAPSLSKALVACHRGTYLNSHHTGMVGMRGSAFVLAIQEAEVLDPCGLHALEDATSGEEFFETLGVDRLETNGPWILEVHVDAEKARTGADDWKHLRVQDARRPSEQELVDAMLGRAGWKVL